MLYVIDLYARDGDRPDSFGAALERMNDLLFGNQTYVRLKYCLELSRLRGKRNNEKHGSREKIVMLSYRAGMEETGPEKAFEFSGGALAQRWQAGVLDMKHSDVLHSNEDIVVVRRT